MPPKHRCSAAETLGFTWPLAAAADDAYFLCGQRIGVVEFEVDVLDDKRPDVVTKPIGVKMALKMPPSAHIQRVTRFRLLAYLEGQASFDFLSEDLSDRSVEVRDDLHGQLRLKPLIADEIVERVGQSLADTKTTIRLGFKCEDAALKESVPATPIELVVLLLR